MSPDPLENNVARLVRASALPLEDDRRRRAREDFLRAAGAPRRSRGPSLALAAAALLFGFIVLATTRSAPPATLPVPDREPAQEKAPAWVTVFGYPRPESDLYKATLKMSAASKPIRRFRFEVHPPLPEGTEIKLRIESMRERLEKGRLVPSCQIPAELRPDKMEGGFAVEWEGPVTEKIRILLSAPDSLQDQAVLEKLKEHPDRLLPRTFLYYPFDDRWPGLVEPQLLELGDFARLTGELLDRVEAACASAELFKSLEKDLTAEAERLQARIEGFEQAGLYPASARVLADTVRDLAKSMKDFVWKDGKFDGTSSYYTPSKRGTTHRGDVFGFAELRRYKDEALAVGGQEFLLWIAVDFGCRGLRPDTFDRIQRMKKWPSVDVFAALSEPLTRTDTDPEAAKTFLTMMARVIRDPADWLRMDPH